MHEISESEREKAVAVAVSRKGQQYRELAMEHLDELEFLAETAGAHVIAKVLQERERPDGATYVGKGKVAEIKSLVEEGQATMVIFDDDLSPAQVRNLEKELEVKVLDRSGLILDIFASRARTPEAKVQVELAQSQYMLPRLTRMWTHLSKQFGGVGTKGPGETQIETDRRMLRDRIVLLKERLAQIATQREQQRKGRTSLPRFALVGYTNAGKSTLMNALTNAEVLAENKLFATLDTTVRTFELPSGQKALLSDTVGFIRKLPAHLVASFRSTLAEAAEADVLLHVVDMSHPAFREQIEVVNETLRSLNIESKPTVLVFNKVDLVQDRDLRHMLEEDFPGCVFVTAARHINILHLSSVMQETYNQESKSLRLLVPYTNMKLISEVYEWSEVLEREDRDEGVYLVIKLPKEINEQTEQALEPFILR